MWLARFVLTGLLGGCSAGYGSVLPAAQAQPALSNPKAPAPGATSSAMWVYTTSLDANDANVYQRSQLSLTPVKTLSSRRISDPGGTVVTPDGRWYIANGGHSNVLVYRTGKNGPRGPVATLDDSGQVPINVAVSSDRQLVAVSNKDTTTGGAGTVSVYVKGAVEPARALTYGSSPLAGMGVAIDRRGNCYWSFNDPNAGSGSIVKFTRCTGTGTVVISGIANAGGIVFNERGDLYYIDQSHGIYKCKGTSSCVLFSTGWKDPTNMNFDNKGRHLWVADQGGFGYIAAVNPETGDVEYEILTAGNGPFGIAPAPGV